VVIVGRRDSVLFAQGYGHTGWDRKTPRPDPLRTQWDLASLTKVVATTGSVMTLVDAGRLDLDAPVERYLPRFGGGSKSAVTVRMLLDHTSGLPAFVPFYRWASGREDVISALFEVPLESAPGGRVRYSDLNAILLGLLVESLSGTTLDRFAEEAVFGPLGMGHTGFVVADLTHVAPSIAHRGRPSPGEVNDRNAWSMGGVAGHAGLFATGIDLARYAQTWLNQGAGPNGVWVGPGTVRRFLESSPNAGNRVLGWERPDTVRIDRSPFGRAATATTFGHTGWTGTFLWFDPKRDLFLVFLTNRSLGPNSRGTFRAIREIRARLSEAAGAAARGG
jgi:CubicO group peptidase (beta-lactamase class C family)